jgi:hypothetical protein
MNDAWFDPGMVGGLIGSALGLAGALVGTLGGIFAPRGRFRRLVMSVHCTVLLGSVGLLLVSGAAFAKHQPWEICYALGYPGLLGAVIFGSLFPVLRKRYREAELRKAMAQDL